MLVLVKPIITEKATNLSETQGTYGFIVHKKANKIQIKNAVEEKYGVKVAHVRTMRQPYERKVKYTKKGISVSRQGGLKKAFVKLVEGDVIDFYSNI